MTPVPLSILDLVPISAGSDAATALRNTIDLAQHAERLGYQRYWIAEHHLNPGVAGASPPVVLALLAGATERIRIGSGGVQLGHRTALSVVEEFGLIDALHPGRLDLGLGRSGGRNHLAERAGQVPATPSAGANEPRYTENGLLLPPKVDLRPLLNSPRVALTTELVQQPGATTPDYADHVGDILALLRGEYRSADGIPAKAVPGDGADVEVWILGSSAGQSATVAGKNSLPFAANYHVSPSTVIEAVDAYRASFTPSATLDRPYVLVSADVVVAEDDARAHELATGYGPWVHSIRSGAGAIPFPTPEQAAAYPWTDADRTLVADRVDTQFVGSPRTVAAKLHQLQQATAADELAITTITHAHPDRLRSYELLAHEWPTT